MCVCGGGGGGDGGVCLGIQYCHSSTLALVQARVLLSADDLIVVSSWYQMTWTLIFTHILRADLFTWHKGKIVQCRPFAP